MKEEDYKLEKLVGLVERTILRTTLKGTYFEPGEIPQAQWHYNDETRFQILFLESVGAFMLKRAGLIP